LAKAGIDEATILAKISSLRCQFRTSTDALIQLKQSGMSAAALKAVVAAGKDEKRQGEEPFTMRLRSRLGSEIYVAMLVGIFIAPSMAAQCAFLVSPTGQHKPGDLYTGMLARVLRGDMTVDFGAFRMAGAQISGRSTSAIESQDHKTFSMRLADSDYQGALDCANRSLERNYASLIGHFDAMVASQALHRTDEAAAHERVLNALVDSIQRSGDGAGPETAWHVVSIPEEHLFLGRALGTTEKGFLASAFAGQTKTFVVQGGHAYDRLEVPDAQANQTHYVWFNRDIEAGPNPAQMELRSDSVDLLAGRLAIRVPTEAKIEARRASIMAAAESVEQESRIVLDYGSQKMVLMVSETFNRATSDFQVAVQTKMAPVSNRIAAWDLQSPLRGVAYWPNTSSWTAEANLVMGLYVLRPDQTVQHLAFYLNPAAAEDLAVWENLARKIAASVTDGREHLTTQAGERAIAGFVAAVPDGYVTTTQRGPDFSVYHLHKITEFGDPASTLNIYTGNHPHGLSNGQQPKTSRTTLLGVPAEWHETTRKENSETVISNEAILLIHGGSPALYAHIFLTSGNSAQMDELKRIAASLRSAAGTPVARTQARSWRIARLTFDGPIKARPVLMNWSLPPSALANATISLSLTVDKFGNADVSFDSPSKPIFFDQLRAAIRTWKFRIPDDPNAHPPFVGALELTSASPSLPPPSRPPPKRPVPVF
jgi:acylphosphatase